MKIEYKTIVRTIILIISLVNIVLEIKGVRTLPIDNETVEETVSVLLLLYSAISSWWHNNSFTKNAILADEYKKELCRGNVDEI